jgi:hypothetical protein
MTSRSSPMLLAALLLTATAADTHAQQRRGRQPEVARWAPVALGVRFGWDQNAQQEVLGAQIRVPVLRSGMLEIVPSADVTFIPVEKDYQYAVEAAWVSGGARGGLMAQAGVAWRSTTITADEPDGRETFFGYVVGIGGKSMVGPVQVELGLRWIFLDGTTYRPSLASLGVNLPLWSAGDRGASR